jgi:hypothetical protein
VTPGYLALFGLFVGVWLGGLNLVLRRVVTRSNGPLGGRHAIWYYRGFLLAPDWLSYSIIVAGVLIMAVAGVWALLGGPTQSG